jgi:hypothetical protein
MTEQYIFIAFWNHLHTSKFKNAYNIYLLVSIHHTVRNLVTSEFY